MAIKDIILLIHYLLLLVQAGLIEHFKYELDSTPKDLVWCGKDNHIAIILTNENSVYRSEDNGLHWKKLNDIFSNTGKDELEANDNEIGRVSQIIQSPCDKSLLIFLGTHGINWVMDDCGNKIRALNSGRRISEFYFHPTEREWGLASAYSICDDFKNEPCKLYKEIYYTKDLGNNWELLAGYVYQFSWGLVEKKQKDKGVPKERILITYEPRGKGDQGSRGWNYKIDFVYSDDFFKTKVVSVSKGNKFLLTNHYLFVVQVVDQEAQEVMLVGSKSTHKEYSFVPIETGLKAFTEHSYTFLDTSLHSVFLHINHFSAYDHYGHIYTSGIRGLRYSLSLRNNLRSFNGQCDFEKINSVEGLYVANVISGKYIKMAKAEMDLASSNRKESMSQQTTSSAAASGLGSTASSALTYLNYVRTHITYNKGGDWKRISAPERDSQGNKIECGQYCYLNLFGGSSDYPTFYSVDSAAGIIIANGNIGHYLDYSGKEVNTYLTRDGGLNWFEIRKGPHIYEIGDHGGLILLADYSKPSNVIHYTWNEGLSWEELIISNTNFTIKNIIIEPTSSSHHFMVYGDVSKGGNKRGIVVGIDFGNIFPQCVSADSPDTEKSDYERWSPNDGRAGRECLLGKKTTIIRRKRDRQCVNTQAFERKVFIEYCECSEEDYQCDLEYGRNEPGSPCVKLNEGDKETIHEPPANCEGKYYISKGYRRIPGDKCIKGVKFDPIAIPCPYTGIFSFKFVIVMLMVCGIGWFVVDCYLNKKCGLFSYLFERIGLYSNKRKEEPYHHINLGNEDEDNDRDNVLFDEEDKVNDHNINKEREKNKDNKPSKSI